MQVNVADGQSMKEKQKRWCPEAVSASAYLQRASGEMML